MSRYSDQIHQYVAPRIEDSQITTQSELQRYEAFSQHVTRQGMIQSTIYHIRTVGKNIYNPQEREQYYSDDFLHN